MELISPDFGLIFWMILSLLLLILPMIALIDLLRSRFEGNDKLVWTIVIIFVVVIGSILYFVIGRKQKINKGNQQF
ncbi:MAG TPA: PLDc N-terminal domain-containing protein [Bacteroidales bacterium]